MSFPALSVPNKCIPPESMPKRCLSKVNPGILKSNFFPGKFTLNANALCFHPLGKR